MRTGNPALSDRAFRDVYVAPGSEVMTLEGTVNKTVLSLLVTVGGAYVSWTNPELSRYFIVYAIGALLLALAISFKKSLAQPLTLVYAAVEGLLLGAISKHYEALYSGIVFQAVSLTFGTLICLLMAYKSGLIRATENFKLGVAAATGGIFLVYLVSFVMMLFGVRISFLYDASPISIGISCIVATVAALNLVLDFDFIETAAQSRSAPKYMEWYGAFGLLVTLVWLYVEILRLLAKLQRRD